MTENFIRHFISFIAVIVALVIYWGGYISGSLGWWWAGLSCLFAYVIVYKLLEI